MAKKSTTMVRDLFERARKCEREAARYRQAAKILMGYKLDTPKEKRVASPPPNSRATYLYKFLSTHGPSTVKSICDKTGVNYATIYCALTRHENKLFSRDMNTKEWAIIDKASKRNVLNAMKSVLHDQAKGQPSEPAKKNYSDSVYAYLRNYGPSMARTISEQAGINLGTVRSILQRNTRGLFALSNGRWGVSPSASVQSVKAGS